MHDKQLPESDFRFKIIFKTLVLKTKKKTILTYMQSAMFDLKRFEISVKIDFL